MVFVKVTVGGETRRLQLGDGDITYKEIQDRIASLFPGLKDEAANLRLNYKDEDGDTVAVSSDEEVNIALSGIPPEGTWRVLARVVRDTKSKPTCTRHSSRSLFSLFEPLSIFESLLDTSPTLGKPLFSHLNGCGSSTCQLLKEKEELLEKLRKVSEQTKQPTSDKPSTEEKTKTDEPEVKSKTTKESKSSENTSSIWDDFVELSPGFYIRSFGNWEPKVVRKTVYGPTGFHCCWKWTDKEEKKEEKKDEPEKDSETTSEKKEETVTPSPDPDPETVTPSLDTETTIPQEVPAVD